MKNAGFKWIAVATLVMFSCVGCFDGDGSNSSGQSVQHNKEGAGDDTDDLDDSWRDSGTGGTHQGTSNADTHYDADTMH